PTTPRGPQVIRSEPRPSMRTHDEDDEPVWRGPPLVKGGWHWWVLAAAAVVGAVLLGIRIGLGPASSTATASAPPPVNSPEAAAMEPVRRAIDAYRLRAKLFANRQMTCDDLAQSFSNVDEEWLRYTLAATPTMLTDSTAASPQGSLAADVDDVEGDFERSGCPRP
ncbi:MAG TPA: hypothetical protein VGV12_02120, partial [Gemmatimonadales bacterium]|nr:hypothetical protein [Gemmatimonadales bacterium]